jgi:hypothetical protein
MGKEAERLRALNAVLSQWRGEQAQFWTYTAALACLEIRLFSRHRLGNVHLICSPSISIMGPVFWEPCALTVTAEDAEDEHFIVQDASAGVRVVCRQVDLIENVDLFMAAPGVEESRPLPADLTKAS